MDRLERAKPLMAALAETLERDGRTRDLLALLYAYLWSAAPADVADEDIRSILLQIAGANGAEDVMNAAQQLIEQGRAEGLQGLRTGVLAALSARNVALSEVGRARLASCTDLAMLTRWLTRAVTATSEATVFGNSDAP